MAPLHLAAVTVACTLVAPLAVAVFPTTGAAAQHVPDAALVQFEQRLGNYVRLRDSLKLSTVFPMEPEDRWTALLQRRRLGQFLRIERADVGEGNVFGDIVGRWFRGLTMEAMRSVYLRSWLSERESYPHLRTEVNEQFPVLGDHDVPPMLLHILPELPPGIEYRVVGMDLVLWDETADVVIDILRYAFPITTTVRAGEP